jgi:acetyl-CoA acetyltransferase
MKDVAVVSYCRTGIAKAVRGALNQTHGIPLAAHVLRQAVERARIDPAEVEDVVLGCGLPEGATGHNIARNAALEAGFGEAVPGATINRYCGSGLTAASIVANRIAAGEASIAIAGGVPRYRSRRSCGARSARGVSRMRPGDELAGAAQLAGLLSEEDLVLLRAADRARDQAIQVDAFSPEEFPIAGSRTPTAPPDPQEQ